MNDGRPQIVVVDPDADFATALSSLLDQRGYQVVRRSFGIDALRYVAEDRPALVVSELDLPDCDSNELLNSIRASSPSTQVLFITHGDRGNNRLSGSLDQNVIRLSRQAGESEGVLKAVDRLLERVAS